MESSVISSRSRFQPIQWEDCIAMTNNVKLSLELEVCNLIFAHTHPLAHLAKPSPG